MIQFRGVEDSIARAADFDHLARGFERFRSASEDDGDRRGFVRRERRNRRLERSGQPCAGKRQSGNPEDQECRDQECSWAAKAYWGSMRLALKPSKAFSPRVVVPSE